MPVAAQQNTPDGAVAFVQYFYDEVNRAYKNPGSANVKRLCVEGVTLCDAMQKEVDTLQKNGEVSLSNLLSYNSVQAGPVSDDGAQKVGAYVKSLDHEIGRGGVPVRRVNGNPEFAYVEHVKWVGDGWKLTLHTKVTE